MKKLTVLFLSLFVCSFIFAQEAEVTRPDFKFRVNEGASFAQVTRIEKMKDRSNFVRENFMVGAFVNFQTVDLYNWIDFTLQLDAYYPFYNAFNGMKQYPKNMFNYGIDTFLGATVTYEKLKYVNLDLSLGLHYMYQLTDEYYMNYVGLGFLGTIDFPLTKTFTIVNNYFFSYDDANLGSNKKIQPFAASYQYHIDLGICISKKAPNNYCYFTKKETPNEIADELF